MSLDSVKESTRPAIPLVLWCGLSLWVGCWISSQILGVCRSDITLLGLLCLALGAGVVLWFLQRNGRNCVIAACLLFLVLGGLLWNVNCLVVTHQQSELVKRTNTEVVVRIEEDPSSGLYGSYCTAQVFESNSHLSLGLVSLSFEEELFSYGDEIRAVLSYSRPRESSEVRSVQQGIACFASLESYTPLESSSLGIVAQVRNAFISQVDTCIKEQTSSREAGALIQALITGDRSELFDLELYQEVKVLGLAHIVAVSGAHLVIVMGFLALLLRRIPLPHQIRIVIQLGVLALYLCMVGFPISCIRAAFMSALSLLSCGGMRRSHALSALGVVLIVLIGIQPSSAFSLSFLLSALSTLGILVFMPLFLSWFSVSSKPVQTFLIEPFAMTCAALLTTLPFSIASFSMLSLSAPISNIFATPFVTLLCGLGLLAFIAMPLEALSTILLKAALLFAELFCKGCTLLSSIPGAALPLYANESLLVFGMILIVLLLWYFWPQSFSRSMKVLMCFFVLLGVILCVPKQGTTLTMLDVGQGDSFLLQSNTQTILIDTGEDEQKLYAALSRQRCNHLDAVLITHADSDHAGCLSALKGIVSCEKVILAEGFDGVEEEKAQSVLADARLLAGEEGIHYVSAGDSIELETMTLRIIWPETLKDGGGNQDSLCFILEIDPDNDEVTDWKALFTGDAEAQTLNLALKSYPVEAIDILKVAHHGAKASLSDDLVETLSPRLSLISVGEENRYGHPAEETLERLDSVQSRIFRSDLNGDVVCSFTREEIEIETLR